MNSIDLVVPYVDSSDPNWIKLYNQYNPNPTNLTEEVNAMSRFRGQGDFFKFFFRCVDKNLSWINNIFLLVQSESQVPSWLDTSKVKIIYHKDFIPEEFLPTFNSTCIEMFLWNIPGLGEQFLYANDDIFVVKPLIPELFYKNGKVRNNSSGIRTNSMWGCHIKNTYTLIYDKKKEDVDKLELCPGFSHLIRPYLKSQMKVCFNIYKEQILASISKFRETKNLNVYLFDHFLIKNQMQTFREVITGKTISSKNSPEDIRYILNKYNFNMLCVEDNKDDVNIYTSGPLNSYFYSKFSNKSKYEK